MLNASMLTQIDLAVQQVAQAGHGAVVIVVEKGRPRRLRLEVDLSWDKRPDQVLELNSSLASQ